MYININSNLFETVCRGCRKTGQNTAAVFSEDAKANTTSNVSFLYKLSVEIQYNYKSMLSTQPERGKKIIHLTLHYQTNLYRACINTSMENLKV